MPMRKREEVQEMSRRSRLIGLLLLACATSVCVCAQSSANVQTSVNAQTSVNDDAIWQEYGLAEKTTAQIGPIPVTVYRMNDITGAFAAWEWQRLPNARPCNFGAFCTASGDDKTVASANYLLKINGPVTAPQLDAFIQKLPMRHEGTLPAILGYVPRKNLIPNSARYILGPASMAAFAPQLNGIKPGFNEGVEAQVASYKDSSGTSLHLAVFYYPAPEMARLRYALFKQLPDIKVKRSDVLLAVVFGRPTEQQANTILSRVEYEAKIIWDEIPPPSPIKPLYQLLGNILFMSIVLIALCATAGLIYAGIRLYRRRFGSLDDEEAMTTLHLSGD
jgi:hypothetical protein